eukprot:g14535.t1
MGKKKKEGGGEKAKPLTNLEVYDEVRMRFEVRKQTERADLYEQSFKDLKKKNEVLKAQYYSQRDTQADILKTLKANLEDQYLREEGKVDKHELVIDALHRSMEDVEDSHRKELTEKDEEWNLKLQEAQAKIDDLQTALENVKGYIKRRNEMQETMETLELHLKKKDEERDQEVAQLDRKKAMEIDQLKKDMLARIRETRDSLRMKTKEQLDVITKRTIMENEQLTSELAFQKKEVERVLGRSKKMEQENVKLRRNLELHSELEEELAKRTNVYQKLIQKLNGKVEAFEQQVSSPKEGVEMSVTVTNQEPAELSTLLKVGNSRATSSSNPSAIGHAQTKSRTSNNNFVNKGKQGGLTTSGKAMSAEQQVMLKSPRTGIDKKNNPDPTSPTSKQEVVSAGINAATTTKQGAALPHHQAGASSPGRSPRGGRGGGATANVETRTEDKVAKKTIYEQTNAQLHAEVETLRRRLEQSQDELKRFRRDHLAVLNLSDQTTRMIILELYQLKRSMEGAGSGRGANQGQGQLHLQPNYHQNQPNPDAPIFQQLSERQRNSFFRLLLHKLAHKRLEPKTKRLVDRVLADFECKIRAMVG